jgi:hypothetical protein
MDYVSLLSLSLLYFLSNHSRCDWCTPQMQVLLEVIAITSCTCLPFVHYTRVLNPDVSDELMPLDISMQIMKIRGQGLAGIQLVEGM